MTGLWVAIGSGVLLAAGLWALAGYFVPAHPRLADTLRVLDAVRDVCKGGSARHRRLSRRGRHRGCSRPRGSIRISRR